MAIGVSLIERALTKLEKYVFKKKKKYGIRITAKPVVFV